MSETYSNDGPQCPHCGRQYTADEPHYYDEMNYTRDTCDECEKPFAVRVHTSVSWWCEPMEPPAVAETSRDGSQIHCRPLRRHTSR